MRGSRLAFRTPNIESLTAAALKNRNRRITYRLDKAAEMIVTLAQSFTPEDTGALASAIEAGRVKISNTDWTIEIKINENVPRLNPDGTFTPVGVYAGKILYAYGVMNPGPGTLAKAAARGAKAGGNIQNPSKSVSKAVTEYFIQRAANILLPEIRRQLKEAIK